MQIIGGEEIKVLKSYKAKNEKGEKRILILFDKMQIEMEVEEAKELSRILLTVSTLNK